MDPSVKKVRVPTGIPAAALRLNPQGGMVLESQFAVSVADGTSDLLGDLNAAGPVPAAATGAGAENGTDLALVGGNGNDGGGTRNNSVIESGLLRRPLPRPHDYKERKAEELREIRAMEARQREEARQKMAVEATMMNMQMQMVAMQQQLAAAQSGSALGGPRPPGGPPPPAPAPPAEDPEVIRAFPPVARALLPRGPPRLILEALAIPKPLSRHAFYAMQCNHGCNTGRWNPVDGAFQTALRMVDNFAEDFLESEGRAAVLAGPAERERRDREWVAEQERMAMMGGPPGPGGGPGLGLGGGPPPGMIMGRGGGPGGIGGGRGGGGWFGGPPPHMMGRGMGMGIGGRGGGGGGAPPPPPPHMMGRGGGLGGPGPGPMMGGGRGGPGPMIGGGRGRDLPMRDRHRRSPSPGRDRDRDRDRNRDRDRGDRDRDRGDRDRDRGDRDRDRGDRDRDRGDRDRDRGDRDRDRGDRDRDRGDRDRGRRGEEESRRGRDRSRDLPPPPAGATNGSGVTVVTVKALTGNKANAGRGDLRMELNNSGGPGKEGSRDRGGRPARTVEIVTVGRKRGRDSGGAGGEVPSRRPRREDKRR